MRRQLADEIRNCLKVLGARVPRLVQRKPEKLYEIYVLSCVIRAGRLARLRVSVRDDDCTQNTLTVRGGPGSIYNSTGPNTYVLMEGRAASLEIQHGIYVGGYSGEPHEADIALINHDAGRRCRSQGIDPDWRKSSLITECKFYKPNPRNTNLPHSLGCNLLGMSAEFPRSMLVLCANQSKPAIERMLSAHQRQYRPHRRAFFDLIPTRPEEVNGFRHWLAAELRHLI
jgi:hypothetical protein